MVNEHADELVADRFVHEGGSYRRVDASGEATNDPTGTDLFADARDLLGNDVARVPVGGHAGGLFGAFALQGAGFHHGAAQLGRKFFHINGVAMFAHKVRHVQRHHHGQAHLQNLGGEIQVALNVGAVHQV